MIRRWVHNPSMDEAGDPKEVLSAPVCAGCAECPWKVKGPRGGLVLPFDVERWRAPALLRSDGFVCVANADEQCGVARAVCEAIEGDCIESFGRACQGDRSALEFAGIALDQRREIVALRAALLPLARQGERLAALGMPVEGVLLVGAARDTALLQSHALAACAALRRSGVDVRTAAHDTDGGGEVFGRVGVPGSRPFGLELPVLVPADALAAADADGDPWPRVEGELVMYPPRPNEPGARQSLAPITDDAKPVGYKDFPPLNAAGDAEIKSLSGPAGQSFKLPGGGELITSAPMRPEVQERLRKFFEGQPQLGPVARQTLAGLLSPPMVKRAIKAAADGAAAKVSFDLAVPGTDRTVMVQLKRCACEAPLGTEKHCGKCGHLIVDLDKLRSWGISVSGSRLPEQPASERPTPVVPHEPLGRKPTHYPAVPLAEVLAPPRDPLADALARAKEKFGTHCAKGKCRIVRDRDIWRRETTFLLECWCWCGPCRDARRAVVDDAAVVPDLEQIVAQPRQGKQAAARAFVAAARARGETVLIIGPDNEPKVTIGGGYDSGTPGGDGFAHARREDARRFAEADYSPTGFDGAALLLEPTGSETISGVLPPAADIDHNFVIPDDHGDGDVEDGTKCGKRGCGIMKVVHASFDVPF